MHHLPLYKSGMILYDGIGAQIGCASILSNGKVKIMIKAGIIGATGYAGAELARILMGHPEAEIISYGSKSYAGSPYADIYRNMNGFTDSLCEGEDMDALAEEADVIFTATPQGFCASKISEELLSRTKVIDLSADFRIKDAARYEEWYNIHHPAPEFLPEAVYGLPERNRDAIARARLIANPGCYPTCSILSILPAVSAGIIDPDSVIIDAKSGTTGAGRGAKVANLFCEVNENIKAYGVASHRHTPEIEDQLALAAGREVTISFTPHLVPMERGILVTAYAALKKDVTWEDVREIYGSFYDGERFVRVLGQNAVPETRYVRGSNFADVGFRIDRRCRRLIMMGAIDNLVKGAAGQAVQNMNLMFGLPEETALTAVPTAF